MDPNKRNRLAALAERQHGLFNVWQANDVGVSSRELTEGLARGELVRIRPRVYLVHGAPVDWLTELHADVLSAPAGAWASHGAALRLHGIDHEAVPFRQEILTVGTGLVEVDPTVVVHRTRSLARVDITEVHGIPTTSLARTVVDLTPVLTRWAAIDLADRAICTHPWSRGLIHRTALRLRNGRAGVTRLARLTADGAEEAFWSWLERQAAPLVRRAGVSDARWNVRIQGLPGAGVVDTYSHEHRLIIEWKGLAFHRRPDQLQRDSDKQNAAVAAGLRHLSFTWLDVVERGDETATMIAATVQRTAAA